MSERARAWLIVAATTSVVLLAFLVVWPAVDAATASRSGTAAVRNLPDLDEAERVRMWAIELFTIAWIFFFGGTIGSFINVVAYRMPQGMSVVWRPSHCPRCSAKIRARDNLPVFGWLLLRGRCRDCGLPVSIRYPLVELLMATVFLLLLKAELLSGGANLPLRAASYHVGAMWVIWSPQWELISLYLYHCLCFSFLLPLGLMHWDRNRPPLRFHVTAFLAMLALPPAAAALLPQSLRSGPRDLHPVPWAGPKVGLPELSVPWPESVAWLAALEPAAIGMIAGLLLGWMLVELAGMEPQFLRIADVLAFGLVGGFFGWQAGLSIAALAGAIHVLIALLARPIAVLRRFPLAGSLFAATVLHVCLWRWLSATQFWPAAEVSAAGCAVSAAAVMLGAVLLRFVALPPPATPAPQRVEAAAAERQAEPIFEDSAEDAADSRKRPAERSSAPDAQPGDLGESV